MAGVRVAGVRALYKRLLRLHRRLPGDLRDLGDQYVKDEFRKSKAAGAAETARFMEEWQVPSSLTSFTALINFADCMPACNKGIGSRI